MSDKLPLQGIRVIDFGQFVAVPFATQWMALMGAEVIVVESHERLSNRMRPPFADGIQGVNRSGGFQSCYRNKLGCTLNLRTDKGRDIVLELARISDVVADNYSTGTMEKLGLGYQDLVNVRSDIIMVSLGAVGRTGPQKNIVGLHSVILMFSGLAAITGYPQGHPRVVGSVFPDPVSGAYSVFAVLLALFRRSKTGHGQYIDAAMTEAMMTLMPEAIIDYTLNHREPERVGNRDPAKAPHGVYRCKGDDAWVAISVGSDDQWKALCDAVGHSEWADDPRFSDCLVRWRHQEELDALVQLWTRERLPDEAMGHLQGTGVPAGSSLSAAGILSDSHLRQREFVVEVDHPEVGRRSMGNVPWKISDLPSVEQLHAPLFGQHNQYVLCELLGYSPEQVEQLVKDRVVY